MHGHDEELASYEPTTDPIVLISETGSVHIQYSDIPKPYPSWVWVENDLGGYWDSPVPTPTDGKSYFWDENIKNWVELKLD
jgi:hypothetical protein